MKHDKNDPLLTAYALGEASAEERAQVEQLIQDNPEVESWINEIRNVAFSIETELTGLEDFALTSEQRENLLNELDPEPADIKYQFESPRAHSSFDIRRWIKIMGWSMAAVSGTMVVFMLVSVQDTNLLKSPERRSRSDMTANLGKGKRNTEFEGDIVGRASERQEVAMLDQPQPSMERKIRVRRQAPVKVGEGFRVAAKPSAGMGADSMGLQEGGAMDESVMEAEADSSVTDSSVTVAQARNRKREAMKVATLSDSKKVAKVKRLKSKAAAYDSSTASRVDKLTQDRQSYSYQVRTKLQSKVHLFNACYVRAKFKDKGLKVGYIRLAWFINKDGKAQNTKVLHDGIKSANVTDCVKSELHKLTLPKTPRPTGYHFEHTFNFK